MLDDLLKENQKLLKLIEEEYELVCIQQNLEKFLKIANRKNLIIERVEKMYKSLPNEMKAEAYIEKILKLEKRIRFLLGEIQRSLSAAMHVNKTITSIITHSLIERKKQELGYNQKGKLFSDSRSYRYMPSLSIKNWI